MGCSTENSAMPKQAFRVLLIAVSLMFLANQALTQSRRVPPGATQQAECGVSPGSEACTPNLGPVASAIDSSIDRRVDANVLDSPVAASDLETLRSARTSPSAVPTESSAQSLHLQIPVNKETVADPPSELPPASVEPSASFGLPLATLPTDALAAGSTWPRRSALTLRGEQEKTRQLRRHEAHKTFHQQCSRQNLSDAECRLKAKNHEMSNIAHRRPGAPFRPSFGQGGAKRDAIAPP